MNATTVTNAMEFGIQPKIGCNNCTQIVGMSGHFEHTNFLYNTFMMSMNTNSIVLNLFSEYIQTHFLSTFKHF